MYKRQQYNNALAKDPENQKALYNLGTLYVYQRQFDQAIADFKQAAALAKGRSVEIEPDGIPNRLNQPLSSLQFNIYIPFMASLWETNFDYF